MSETDDSPYGVGGWLALLVAGMLVLGPLLSIGRIYGEFSAAELNYPALAKVAEWSSFKAIEWVVLLVFCAISIYGGLGLATKRTPDAVARAKLILWFNYPLSIIVAGMIIPLMMLPDSGKAAAMNIPPLIASLIAVAIWTAYLNRSKRVKNTYGLRNAVAIPAPVSKSQPSELNGQSARQPSAVFKSPALTTDINDPTPNIGNVESSNKRELNMNNLEDWAYEKVAEELESNKPDKVIWTKAFAQSGGDDRQTRVLYIKARVDKLIAQEKSRVEEVRKAHEDAERVASEQQKRDRLEVLARMSKMEQILDGKSKEDLNQLAFSKEGQDFLNYCGWGYLSHIKDAVNKTPLLLAVANSGGNTGLALAVITSQSEVAKFLVEMGSNPLAANRTGETPLSIAKAKGVPDIVRILESSL